MRRSYRAAFTLIELAVVLVIIGLVAGAIFTGRTLIQEAEIRAQLSQLHQYTSAAGTFQAKYGGLPGDLARGASYGLHARQNCRAFGNGDGLIEGTNNVNAPCVAGQEGGAFYWLGEAMLFWDDLTKAKLIGGGPPPIPDANYYCLTAGVDAEDCFLKAKINAATYVTIWSGGPSSYVGIYNDYKHYFGLAGITSSGILANTYPSITVGQAKSMDEKIDDGQPQSGMMMAMVGVGFAAQWAAGGGLYGASTQTMSTAGANLLTYKKPTTVATPYAATNCYDNNNVVGPQKYSLQNEDEPNCWLSLRVKF